MALRMEVSLGPGHIVLVGDPAPLSKKGAEPPPQFSAHFYCGQTAGCIKMPLGMEVGLNPGDFVLDGDPILLPKKGAEPPIFGPCPLRPNGCMNQDATWYGGRPQPRRHCVRWGSLSPKRGPSTLPNFRTMSIVAKRLDGSRWNLAWRWALVQATLCYMGTQPLAKKGAEPPPQFSAHFYCDQTAGCIKMPLGMEVVLNPGHFVMGTQPASPKRGHSPQFSAHVCCGQMAA